MWKALKTNAQTCFLYCNYDNNTEEVTAILYDLKTSWSQTLTYRDVKQKVKLLNRRLDFSDENIKEALTSNVIQYADIIEQPHTTASSPASCLLKLKYCVKNCFLTYEWDLKRQTLTEFQKAFVHPLLLALVGCNEQIELLSYILQKKEIELKQFRIEGAVLNRKTVVTKPFDFDDFNKKFEDCNKTAIIFGELAKYVKESVSEVHNHLNGSEIKPDFKPEEKLNNNQSTSTKLSPRQRKRKMNELKMQYLEQHLKIRKQGLEYESSESQTPSSCSSQAVEGEVNIKRAASKSKNDISLPRRSSRCTSIKQKQDNMCSEDKTDSEGEDLLRTRLERKKIRSLFDSPKDSNTNSNKAQITENTKSNSKKEETKRTTSTSRNSQIEVSKKAGENEKVFDFSSSTEDDTVLSEINNLSKGTRKTNKSFTSSLKDDCRNSSIESPVLDCVSVDSATSINSLSHKNLTHSSSPLVIDEISSQLNNIRKELESLEALRLADLKKRTFE